MSAIGTGRNLKNNISRLFLQEKLFSCDCELDFLDCLAMGEIEEDFGTPTKDECPDPLNPGKFIIDGIIEGDPDLPTTSLNGKLSKRTKSRIRAIGKAACPVYLHAVFSDCKPLDDPRRFDIKYIFCAAFFTNWSTSEIGALTPSDNAVVTQDVDITYIEMLEIQGCLEYIRQAQGITPNPMVCVTLCPEYLCGNDVCRTSCGKLYGVDTLCNIFISHDNGDTWTTTPMLQGCCTGTPVSIFCLNDCVVVVQDDGTLAYISRNDLEAGNTAGWIHQIGNINQVPTAAWSDGSTAIIVTENGFIYRLDSLSLGAELVNAGFAAEDNNLNDVTMSPDGTWVSVGDVGTVVYSRNGTTWQRTGVDPTADNLLSVAAKNRDNWLVGSDTGNVYCTDSSGCSWSQNLTPGCDPLTGPITSIVSCHPLIIWMVVDGEIHRSTDGGCNWLAEPNCQADTACVTQPDFGNVEKLVCCASDADFILGVGTATDNTGLILQGTPEE